MKNKSIISVLIFCIIITLYINISCASYLDGEMSTDTTMPYAPGQEIIEQEQEKEKQEKEIKEQEKQEKEITDIKESTVNEGLGDLDNYKGEDTNSEKLTSIVGNLLGVIRAVGTVVSVVILIGIGIRYLLGSVEEKADYKKSLIPYIVGAAILFTGTTIPQLIYNLVNQI